MITLTHTVAHEWITRWDRQQEGYIPDRETRFTYLIDAVEAGAGRPDPLVLDLGCGPGSLSTRLLDRLPGATVVAIDTDPLLLSLGRAAYRDTRGLRFVDLDLSAPGWTDRLGLDRPADAAVSTTALHWLPEPVLRAVYAELAGALRSGGLFVNGDHMSVADSTPSLARIENALNDRHAARCFGADRPEQWRDWWDAVAEDPTLAGLMSDNGPAGSAAAGHHGNETGLLSTHERALRDAGFAEVGTVWQHGDNRLLCATR